MRNLETPGGKPLIILHGTLKTPPIGLDTRRLAGFLLRRVQAGERLGMPESRPMPAIGPDCHELRLTDATTGNDWRVVYCIDSAAVVVLDVFAKKTQKTPQSVLAACRERLRLYLAMKAG